MFKNSVFSTSVMFDLSLFASFKYYLVNILLISIGPLFRGDYEVFFADHATRRAVQRKIPLDLIEKTVFEGKFERFGENKIKIKKRFWHGAIICIGVIENDRIKILTVERGFV